MKENGNRGNDHGHSKVMLLSGGGSQGRNVYGKRPGLDSSHLYETRNLSVTTEFREVFGEILARRLSVANLTPVFPGYERNEKKRLGIVS